MDVSLTVSLQCMQAFYESLSVSLGCDFPQMVVFVDVEGWSHKHGKVTYMWVPPKTLTEPAVLWAAWEVSSPEEAVSEMASFRYLEPIYTSVGGVSQIIHKSLQPLEQGGGQLASQFMLDAHFDPDFLSDQFLLALLQQADNLGAVMADSAGSANLKKILKRTAGFSATEKQLASACFVEVMQKHFLDLVLSRRSYKGGNGLAVLEELLISSLRVAVDYMTACVRSYRIRVAREGTRLSRKFALRVLSVNEKTEE